MADSSETKLKLEKSNFPEWYSSVLSYTKFLDERFPLKGAYVWQPFGFKALKLMLAKVDEELVKIGCEECYFPMFSPASLFEKESDFLKGMKAESLRVTHYGDNKLSEEMIVRPTSETIMYPMFSMWIRSENDLPLKVYQTVNMFRWETKMTSPMLRVREVIKFNESHTAHATREDMASHIKEAVAAYIKIFDWMMLPYIMVKTPSWDTFPGAEFNIDFYAMLPNGKAAELASVIGLAQRFSKAYDISFTDEKGNKEFVWQTCYGLSERALGTCIAIHGDNLGLKLPTHLCPIQVVIVPISGKEPCEGLAKFVEDLDANLSQKYRVHVDRRDKRPGEKFYHWEAHGVPVRIEVGKKEFESGKVTIAARIGGKQQASASEIAEKIDSLFVQHDAALAANAKEVAKSAVQKYSKIEDALAGLSKGVVIVGLPWDKTKQSADAIMEKIPGTALGTLYSEESAPTAPDPTSGKKAEAYLYIARTV